MELALSLGDATKPFSLMMMEKKKEISTKNKTRCDINGFCMSLSLGDGGSGGGKSQDNTNSSSSNNSKEDGGEEEENNDDEEKGLNSSDPWRPSPAVAPPLQLDLLPFSSVHRAVDHHHPLLPLPPNPCFPWLSGNLRYEPGSSDGLLRGLEANRSPATRAGPVAEEAEEESSPNSAASSFKEITLYGNGGARSGKNSNRGVADNCGGGDSRGSDDDENGSSTRKKLRLSKEQSAFLEESFKEHHTLNPKQKLALAKQLNLRPRQVEVWFQNRRARTKLKQTEVDCEYLKRCCETLTEENKRLQKELQELRALKTSQSFYMQRPATTLTMCPSCERVATASNATTTTSLTINSAVAASTLTAAASGAKVAENGSSSDTTLSLAKPPMLPFSN